MDDSREPNFYKIATLLLIFASIISLAALQFCTKPMFVATMRLLTCRGWGLYPGQNGERANASRNLTPLNHTTTPSIDNSSNTAGKKSQSIAYIDDSAVFTHESIQLDSTANESKSNRGIIVAAEEKDYPTFDSNVLEETGIDSHTLQHLNTKHDSYQVEGKEFLSHEQQRLHPLNERRRRSGVCSSLPTGKEIDSLSRLSNPNTNTNEKSDLPMLQLNGIKCERENCCSNMNQPAHVMTEETVDDGQVQCSVQFNTDRNSVTVHSVKIKADMDTERPEFIVEIAVLPKQRVFTKSRAYVASERNVDITLEEEFELSCTQTDIEESTLVLAIKLIYSRRVLFAEAHLKDLPLYPGKEVQLGAYLKSQS